MFAFERRNMAELDRLFSFLQSKTKEISEEQLERFVVFAYQKEVGQ